MKRRLYLTLIVLCTVLLLGAVCEIGSRQVADYYQNRLLLSGAALARGDWNTALNYAQSIAVQWDTDSSLIQLWVNHADVDEVTEGLIGYQTALAFRDQYNAMLYYGQCMENFGHLHHRDAFTLKNIL